ncbi:hypothetical protein IJ103_02990, partial [Candidatus Saccharibacteria bacterium]|nr:hypothetical protein [Candidatus Saccharibacteria bacterium]
TLFKKSLDAFGNLGTKIQGFGQTLGRGATGALRNADWYKNAQERGIERRTRIRAGLDQNGQEQTNPLLRQLRSRNDRTRSRYRSQYLKNQAEQDRASLLNDPRYMEEMRFKQDLAIEGERNEIELMNDPTYRDTLRAKQDSDIEKKQTEAQASALGRGAFVRTDGAAVDGTRTDSLRDALIFEASRANNEQDIGRIRALYDALRAKGDSGIDALDEAWDSGTLQGRGFELIRDNIASDGEIKSKARSLHATANAVQSGALAYDTAGGQVASARANGQYIRSIAADKIPDLTGHELRALSTAARTGNADASEVLYLAFTNRDIARKIKPTDATLVQEGASQHVLAQNIERVDGGLYEYTDPNSGARLARRIEVTRDGRFRYQAGTNNLITDQEFTAQNYTPR